LMVCACASVCRLAETSPSAPRGRKSGRRAPRPQIQPAPGGITLEIPVDDPAVANASVCRALVPTLQVRGPGRGRAPRCRDWACGRGSPLHPYSPAHRRGGNRVRTGWKGGPDGRVPACLHRHRSSPCFLSLKAACTPLYSRHLPSQPDGGPGAGYERRSDCTTAGHGRGRHLRHVRRPGAGRAVRRRNRGWEPCGASNRQSVSITTFQQIEMLRWAVDSRQQAPAAPESVDAREPFITPRPTATNRAAHADGRRLCLQLRRQPHALQVRAL
jgi:hypothetical protein